MTKEEIMKEANRVYVMSWADDEISVDGEWFDKLIENGNYDYDKDHDQGQCEDNDVFIAALADIAGSGVRTGDRDIQLIINELSELQDIIKEKELPDVTVTAVEELYIDDGCQYELRIGGELYANYISAAEAGTIIYAYAEGYKKGLATTAR